MPASSCHSPRISVIMPVYNAERYLAQAIESISRQTFPDFEFIIINDGSTDMSANIIRNCADKDSRIIFVDSKENRGYVERLRQGIACARGEFIARMDADDISLPERFARQVRVLDAHPTLGLLGTSMKVIDAQGEQRRGWIFNATPDETATTLLFTNYFAHPSVMMRASAIPAENYRVHFMPAEDFDLWTRIAEHHMVWSIPEPLILYRDHGANISRVHVDVSRERVIEILKLQLERLGMRVTDTAAAFHNELSFDKVTYDNQGLARAREWYEKIYFTNLITKKYKPHILLVTLIGRWYIICSRQDSKWFLPKKPFWGSALLRLSGLTPKEYLAFMANVGKKAIRYLFF